MLDIANDVQSLSHFKRKTAEVMKRMKKTGNPVVLTLNGKAEIVVQEAAAYQRLRELADKAEMMEFLLESRADMEAGRTEPAIEALERLGKKHQLTRKRK
jgi:prevent-host-death family protein